MKRMINKIKYYDGVPGVILWISCTSLLIIFTIIGLILELFY